MMKKTKHIFFAMMAFVAVVALGERAFGAQDAVYAVVHASDEQGNPVPSAANIERQFIIKPAGTPIFCNQLKGSPTDVAGSKVHLLGCIDSTHIWDFNVVHGGETMGTYPLDFDTWSGNENQPVRFTNLPANNKVKVSVVRANEIDPGFPVGTRLIWLDVKVGASEGESLFAPLEKPERKDLYARIKVTDNREVQTNPSTAEIRNAFAFKLGGNSTQSGLTPVSRDLGSGSEIFQTLIGQVGQGGSATVTYKGKEIIRGLSVEPVIDTVTPWSAQYILPGNENIWAQFQFQVFAYPSQFNKDAVVFFADIVIGDVEKNTTAEVKK